MSGLESAGPVLTQPLKASSDGAVSAETGREFQRCFIQLVLSLTIIQPVLKKNDISDFSRKTKMFALLLPYQINSVLFTEDSKLIVQNWKYLQLGTFLDFCKSPSYILFFYFKDIFEVYFTS